MALFKIFKGLKNNIPSTKTEGYCYYTTDDSLFYIDYKDAQGVLQRKALNAKDAETLTGASLKTILNSSNLEIPTSKAVFDELAKKANATHNHDDKYYTESEMDAKLEGKASTTHTHTIANITNLQTTLDNKASLTHTHDAITNDEIDEICGGTMTTYLNSMSARGVSF